MSRNPTGGSFAAGASLGALCGVAAVCLPLWLLGANPALALLDSVPDLAARLQASAAHNLRGASLAFLAVLMFYVLQLLLLSRELEAEAPALHTVLRREQLLDLCANLFFGIGVIWTAVGMRDALLHGLGDPTLAASAGAFNVLQRLVDGGILLALSTTIVGGVGGYLMRVVKSLCLGQRLAECYLTATEAPAREGLARLAAIEDLLRNPRGETHGDTAP